MTDQIIKIVIPTHKRSDKARYLNFVPKSYLKNVYLAIRDNESEDYRHHLDNGVNIVTFTNLTGIHDKRNAIVKHFKGDRIWMLDDDTELTDVVIREEKRTLKSADIGEESFYEFISYCNDLLDEYPMGIVRPFMFPVNEKSLPYEINKWSGSNVMLDLNVLNADILEYNYLSYFEDRVGYLNTIDRGYNVFNLTKWMVKTDKPGKPGGCRDLRSEEIIEQTAIAFHEKFPQYTSLMESKYIFPGHTAPTKTVKMKAIKRK